MWIFLVRRCAVGVDLACFAVFFGAQAAAVFGVWRLFWPDIYCLKTKFAHQACLFFAKNGLRLVWQKWSKNGLKI